MMTVTESPILVNLTCVCFREWVLASGINTHLTRESVRPADVVRSNNEVFMLSALFLLNWMNKWPCFGQLFFSQRNIGEPSWCLQVSILEPAAWFLRNLVWMLSCHRKLIAVHFNFLQLVKQQDGCAKFWVILREKVKLSCSPLIITPGSDLIFMYL